MNSLCLLYTTEKILNVFYYMILRKVKCKIYFLYQVFENTPTTYTDNRISIYYYSLLTVIYFGHKI